MHEVNRLSLRTEVLRACLRFLIKRRIGAGTSVAAVRRRLARLTWFVPRPPRDTETIATDAGGIAADRIATPASLNDRHVIYFHGGSYLVGSPALYRDLTWRIRRSLPRARAVHRLPAGP